MREILENVCLPSVAFPLLKYIPRRFASWNKRLQGLHEKQADLFDFNFHKALDRQAWSWSRHLQEQKTTELDSKELAYIIGTCYEAGSDTTAFVLEVFLLASVLHKNSVRRAQQEIDSVLGHRMPEMKDLKRLRYVRAYVQEVLRWRPVVPGGIQREAAHDDEYNGFTTPKGTVIVPNHWSLEFDPEVFDDPWAFRPERWIGNPRLPSSAFGFGRRICPGEHLARNSLNLVISRMLWAFNFETSMGKGSVPDSLNMTQGISSRPEGFELVFLPRSAEHRRVIEGRGLKALGFHFEAEFYKTVVLSNSGVGNFFVESDSYYWSRQNLTFTLENTALGHVAKCISTSVLEAGQYLPCTGLPRGHSAIFTFDRDTNILKVNYHWICPNTLKRFRLRSSLRMNCVSAKRMEMPADGWIKCEHGNFTLLDPKRKFRTV
ncbi:hypothetical protein CDD80_383 [Ophiocordyceps camponoti-rufipedis]|uniref:Cytochrome P450 n=1 Tax=Ophiocordyceps camponoti-rufipedis TaxID=2004952 RepID=A0A2C5ZCQ6_9HYPO|nr:hypothetical protein CDD80_383 [Ophiocordyceps camponoti-rufipedis]